MNFQVFKLDLEKAEEQDIKSPTSVGSEKKQEHSRKPPTSAFSLHQSLCVDHNKLWKILQETRIPDHLTYLLRNLYAGQEATVRIGHGTTDWLQIEKGVYQGCMKVKVESEKVGLKLNIQKTKIMASGPITSREIDGETMKTVTDFIFLDSKITADGDCSHEIKRR